MKQTLLVMLAVLIIGVAGCASTPQPFEYHDDRDEKPGPGLFSGDDGGFVIHGRTSDQKTDVEKTPVDPADIAYPEP
ncbi:MAG: hypothetical protein HGJ94_22345 [Desulfosarcina sp.]|nr:hypothetical protein [Desulfosarcina sp.]MBC2745293.1 hypothetical protein [Desulfosarcina sp.]MBC2768199.1 hypothetical protein [Desulfosarcina sp.]